MTDFGRNIHLPAGACFQPPAALVAGPSQEPYHYSGLHDPVSAVTHLLGAAAFAVLGGLLLRRGRGGPTRLAYLAVYAAACVSLLLMASGLYHMTGPGTALHGVTLRLGTPRSL